MLKLISERVVFDDGVRAGNVYIENGTVVEAGDAFLPADTVRDLGARYLAPGFVDLHTHGGGGFPFIDGTAEDAAGACRFHLSHGTTSLMPTVTAGPFEAMRRAVENIAGAVRSGKTGVNVLGVHLEGPYLSAAQCGAQCPDFITPPRPQDYIPLVREYGSFIRRWTYAPENDPYGSFCRFLTENGILPTAGHTDATLDDMKRAVASGCRGVTHLYSCTSTVRRDHGFRIPGVTESTFLMDELFCEIIADGRHLPPDMIRMIVKIKGADRVAACSDSLAIAGTDVLCGEMSGTAFLVEDGVCKLRDRSAFAGSIASGDSMLRVLAGECGFPLPLAFRLLAGTPAAVCGLRKGRVAPGYDADLLVLEEGLRVSEAMIAGRTVFRAAR